MNSAKTMVNVSPKMSNRDAIERELEKFVKMFSTKAVQAIVQSRLGDKMQTFSNPRSLSNDWVSELEIRQKATTKLSDFVMFCDFVYLLLPAPRANFQLHTVLSCSVVVVFSLIVIVVELLLIGSVSQRRSEKKITEFVPFMAAFLYE